MYHRPVSRSLAAPAPTRFGALHHRDYRRYCLFALIGQIAENVEHVISYWVIYQSFHSPTLAGFAVISHWVPYLLFSVYMGALADRYDCRRLIQISQGLFALASLAWGVLFLTDTLRVWHAAVLLLLHGAGGVIAGPAIQLIVHDIVGPDHLPSAIRLNATSRYLATLFGPAVGAGLMFALGPGGGIVANVLLYVPLSIFLLRIRYTGHRDREPRAPRVSRLGFGEMWELISRKGLDRRIILMIVLGGAASFFVGSGFQAQMPEYAHHHHGTDDAGGWYTGLLGANAAGAVTGALLMEFVPRFRPTVRAAIVCAAVWGALMALFPLAHSYAMAIATLMLAGAFNVAYTSMAQTLVQLLAPPALRGRVVGLFNSSNMGLRAGSGFTIGVVGAFIGVELSLTLSAIMVVLIALGLLVADVRRRPTGSST
jgi:MFS family permease